MAEHIDTLIIGGGQAGLAVSYYLTQAGHEHVVLEQAAQPAEVWRNQRWDSFTLVSPNWTLRMPGAEYNSSDPDGFMPRVGIVNYFERYIQQFKLPLRYNVRATHVGKSEQGLRVETNQSTFDAKNVVIATGSFQMPKIPPYAAAINPSIQQLHSGEYRNPDALPPGAVLVVGSAQSGCQIAEELYQSGRTVYLSTGTAGRAPRRYRGQDTFYWLETLGFFDPTVDTLQNPRQKFEGNPQVSGKDGGHTLDLHKFARDGVILLGHIKGASDATISFAPDLYENLAKVDATERQIVNFIDSSIERLGLTAPPETLSQARDGYDAEIITELDLKARGISSLIWAIGYSYDYSWIDFPVRDQDGYPITKRGVTTTPGLYFIGMNWLYKRKSALLWGVGADAQYVAEQITGK